MDKMVRIEILCSVRSGSLEPREADELLSVSQEIWDERKRLETEMSNLLRTYENAKLGIEADIEQNITRCPHRSVEPFSDGNESYSKCRLCGKEM